MKLTPRQAYDACVFQVTAASWAELAMRFRSHGEAVCVKICERRAEQCYAAAREIMRIEE